MRMGLRLFILAFLFVFLAAVGLPVNAAGTGTGKKTAAQKASKQTVKKPSISAGKAGKPTAEIVDAAPTQKNNGAAANDEKVYDLGNIVVKGEDKTRIKDGSKKKTAFITPETESGPGAKKGTAGFVAGTAAGEKAEESSGVNKAFAEVSVGSDSTSMVEGMLSYEKNSPANSTRSRSTIGARGGKTGGYRYKSNGSSLGASYKYESEKQGENATTVEAGFEKFETNLPGFDAFANNFTNSQGGNLKLDAKYADGGQRFGLSFKKVSRDFKINASPVDEAYDSTGFTLGYSRDLIYDRETVSLPLTLELKLTNDSFNIKTAQSASAVSTQFGVNAEKAVNDSTLLQVSPQVFKNGDNDALIGGAVSVVFKTGTDDRNKTRYTVTAGRQALRYDTSDFLFADCNSIVWAQDNAGRNRFDGTTFENDEKFVQIAVETEASEKTKIGASYKKGKSDGLLYLTDLNRVDVRQTFAAFAGGASTAKFKLKASHRLDEGLDADAAVETNSVNDGINDLMPYIPKSEYILGVNYKHECGLFTRFDYKFKGSMDSSKNPAANSKVDSFSTAGLYLDKKFIDNGKIFFKADNLFNAGLKLRPGYGYKARTFALGVNYVY